MNALADLLSSHVKAQMFRLLFGADEARLHLRELARRSGMGLSTVRKELSRLVELRVVEVERERNRTYYRANQKHPFYAGISGLVCKTVGVADVLRRALRDAPVLVAFVCGPGARKPEQMDHGLELIVVGPIARHQLAKRLTWAAEAAGREFNFWLLTAEEFKRLKRKRDTMLGKALAARRLFIVGDKEQLSKL